MTGRCVDSENDSIKSCGKLYSSALIPRTVSGFDLARKDHLEGGGKMKKMGIVGVCLLLGFATVAVADDKAAAMTQCTMRFTIKGWSVFYKTAEGSGRVSCSNGQRADVKLELTGGGLTFGKMEILDGEGTFSGVMNIDEIFGGYAAAEAHAGAVKSAQASVYTKGEVSLALSGTGRGINIGIDFGRLQISRRSK